MSFAVLAKGTLTTFATEQMNAQPCLMKTNALAMSLLIIARNAVESWWQKMWQISEPYYSEKTKLKLLKEASTEQLIEFLLIMTGSAKR